jgi:hypothetical protein
MRGHYVTRREANTAILAGAAVLVAGPASATQETEPIALPPPRSTGGKPLIEALMPMTMMCRQYGAVRSPLGRLTPNAAHRRSDKTCGGNGRSEYSRVDRRSRLGAPTPVPRTSEVAVFCSSVSHRPILSETWAVGRNVAALSARITSSREIIPTNW